MADFGVLGLGVMGSNLAENIEEKGSSVALWNREADKTAAFLAQNQGRRFTGTGTLDEFVEALARPRRVLMMIKAGPPVDQTLERLRHLLQEGDVVIDGGNSWFEDTVRREQECRQRGVHFVGMGVSGGAEGARHGPSLMPGGSRQAWESLRPVLEAIAARTESGPCVTHVGPDGAGHFVKMVHNGIEYGDMQLIAEVYDLLRRGLDLPAERIAAVFERWNGGPLASFLVEITARVLRVQAEDGAPLVDRVVDSAGQKGTGRWTVKLALELGVAIPTIAAAVDARVVSSRKEERVQAEKKLRGPARRKAAGDPEKLIAAAEQALLFGRVCAFAQGVDLIRAGSDEYRWKIDVQEIARIWKGGCIIRSALLDVVMAAYRTRRPPANLLLARDVTRIARNAHRPLRKVLQTVQGLGLPAPALSASLAWYDGIRTGRLPQNLTQAQRDAFGSHGYERLDRPGQGPFHTDWLV